MQAGCHLYKATPMSTQAKHFCQWQKRNIEPAFVFIHVVKFLFFSFFYSMNDKRSAQVLLDLFDESVV